MTVDLRRTLSLVVLHGKEPWVLLVLADALDEAAREAALVGQPDPTLTDLADLARTRATTFLSPPKKAPPCQA